MYTHCRSKSIQVWQEAEKQLYKFDVSMTTEAAHLKKLFSKTYSGDIHLHLIGHTESHGQPGIVSSFSS